MARNRPLYVFLSILGLFLLGTVVVLSSVTYYLAIDPSAYLSELEVPFVDNVTRWNASDHGQIERIPRIIHQTWKTDSLPPRWDVISKACREMMPDYEYMLWTDAGSREFIAEQYPWFLDTFDSYTYAIQRADAIRYFVLHYYGGIYVDLDIGCLRPMDPLLVYSVILPKTIPVGVSNDLMFAEKGHPLLHQTIHNLIAFDHSWILNYPTVMFSTGPMFLSAQYGMYTASHPGGLVRILPKALYGKNAKEGEAPHSFFSHFYGSSWHADDAAFIGFLGTWGKGLMWVGLVILIIGLLRLPARQRKYSLRRIGGYDVLLPRWSQRSGRWQLHMGWPASGTSTQPPSPDGSDSPSSPIDVSLLHLPFDDRPSSPAASDISSASDLPGGRSNFVVDAMRRVRARVASISGGSHHRMPTRPRRRQSRSVLFFLPAIFTQTPDIELEAASSQHTRANSLPSAPILSFPVPRSSQLLPPEKQRYAEDNEHAEGAFPVELRDGLSRSNSRQSNREQLVDLNDIPPPRARSTTPRSASTSRSPVLWDS